MKSASARRTPGTEEPSGLPSLGSHRIGHDLAAASAKALSQGWERQKETSATRSQGERGRVGEKDRENHAFFPKTDCSWPVSALGAAQRKGPGLLLLALLQVSPKR